MSLEKGQTKLTATTDKKRKSENEPIENEQPNKKVAAESATTIPAMTDTNTSNNLLDSHELRGLGPLEDSEDEEREREAKNKNDNQTARTEAFRNYEDSKRQQDVQQFYRHHNSMQTCEFVLECKQKFLKLDKKTMSIWDAAQFLNDVIDDSDPDTDSNQTVHLIQTGESLRHMYPGDEYDWLHLTGFIHDLGKLLAHKNMHRLEQYFVVGDTFPVGCAFDKNIVFSEFFQENPDFNNPKYNTKLGIYSENCGLDSVHMSFGHDEYMYQVCKQNNCKLPEEALYIIRYHSFYAWHDKGCYDYLCNDQDRKMLEWVQRFQKHDLYSKLPEKPDVPKLLPYYRKLMDKYFPPVLRW